MKNLIKFISVATICLFITTSVATAAEQVYFYHNDPAGTPLAMSDSTGKVVWRANYLPFGEEMIDVSTVQNNKMFVGKEKDSESGLYYFSARYMDPAAGRFTSIDPKGPIEVTMGKVDVKYLLNPQRLNRYAYAGNNPYAFVDPNGLDWYYSQYNGRVVHIDNATGVVTDYGRQGYAGKGEGWNNPAAQGVYKTGPLPMGTYAIGNPENITTTDENGREHHLLYAMRLSPDNLTRELMAIIAEDRDPDSFLWHGDNEAKNNKASEGCIVSSPEFRRKVVESGDTTLHVVPIMLDELTPRSAD